MNPAICLMLGIGAVLFQIGGFASPGWVRMSVGDANFDVGLWYACFLGECMPHNENYQNTRGGSFFNDFTMGWLQIRIESCIGVVAGIIGVLMTCSSHRRTAEEGKGIRYVAGAAFLVSGVAMWIPTGRFAQYNSAISSLPYFDFPYSVMLCGIGASLAIIVTFLLISLSCRASQPGHVLQPTAYPMQTVATGHPAQENPYEQLQGYPNQGYPNQGYANLGYPSQGYPSQGYPSQGYPNQGYPNQGYPNQGYRSQGYEKNPHRH